MAGDRDKYSDNPTKEEILARIRDVFEPFGREVAMMTAEFALSPGRMRFLLQKLELPVAPDFEGQTATLALHLARTDLQRFLRRARREIWLEMQKSGVGQTTQTGPPAAESLKAILPQPAKPAGPVYRLPSGTPTIRITPPPRAAPSAGAQAKSADWLDREEPPRRPAMRPPPPSPPLAPPPANTAHNRSLDWLDRDDPPSRPAPASPAATPSAASTPPPPPAAAPTAWVDAPGYKGPERRKPSSDRRESKSRRESVEAISKNKRVGRDRRQKPRGRRSTDKK